MMVRDNGTELTRHALLDWSQNTGVDRGTMSPVQASARCLYRAANSRWHDECLNEHLFLSLAAVRPVVEAWLKDYNTVRSHSSLGGLAPTEFETRLRQGHMDAETELSAV